MIKIETFIVDIDGTICNNTNGDYENAKPIQHRIDKINQLYDKGHHVIYFTARGMGRTGNDIDAAKNKFYDLTFKQLQEWGCKFDSLMLGKPAGTLYIDDKAINDGDFFNYFVRNYDNE